MYLDAWTHVKSLLAKSTEESPATEAIRTLASNWTNEEFVKFVDDLGDLVDKCARLLSVLKHSLTALQTQPEAWLCSVDSR